jgi:hypothetical protein
MTHQPDHQQAPADEAAHARQAALEVGKPDELKSQVVCGVVRQEALVDEGVEETFPASDPVSVKRIT